MYFASYIFIFLPHIFVIKILVIVITVQNIGDYRLVAVLMWKNFLCKTKSWKYTLILAITLTRKHI